MRITLLDILTITGLPVHPFPHSYGDLDYTIDSIDFKPSMVRQPHCLNEAFFEAGERRRRNCIPINLAMQIHFLQHSGQSYCTWTMLAANLFNRQPTSLGQPVLASLYRVLYFLSLQPFDFNNLVGLLWILDLWLQVYFPQFRHLDVDNCLEDQVLGMAFANRDKFDSPAYIECFKYFYHLDESALDSSALILSRTFLSPLEQGFLLSNARTESWVDMFKRAISCYDFGLSNKLHAYELYAPNHFAHQLGFKQEISFPMKDSLNRYLSWRIKVSTVAIDDEQDRYTVHSTFAVPQLPPPVSYICRSTEVSLLT